jgi:hypothetical protein
MDKKAEEGKTTCQDCAHFGELPLQQGGLCKRYPPNLLASQQGYSSTYTPVAKVADACGEFKQLPLIKLNQ